MYSPLRFIPSAIHKRKPLHLAFFVTRRCNARCPFCFYLEKKDDEGGSEDAPPELSRAETERIAASLGNLLWVAFSGGEVYLREDIVEITEIFYKANRPSIMLLPTNGLMPQLIKEKTEAVLKRCPESVVAVKLSLDGMSGTHDALRGIPGSFDRVMKTCESLGELLDGYRNFELGINTVFCSENQGEMENIIDFVKGLRMVKTHTVSMVRGELKDGAYKDIDTDKYLDAVWMIEKGLKDGSSPTYGFSGARIKAAQDIIQRRLIHRTLREKRRIIPCYAGRLNLVLTETGDVYPCESFRKEHRFGNARDFGLNMKRVLSSGRAKEIVSSIRDGCFCTHECYMMTNIFFNPRLYPEVLKEALQIV